MTANRRSATARCVRPPAAEKELADSERTLGLCLPDDLALWWRRADGVRGPVASIEVLPPFYAPYSVAESLASRQLWLDVWADLGDPESAADEMTEPAGSPVGQYLPAFVPIARNGSGDDLFVDLRAGSLHGCVMEWDHEQGCFYPPRWTSIAAMLTDVADALQNGTLTLQGFVAQARARGLNAIGYLPVVTPDGALDWTPPAGG